ncbi:hypothetical protein ElyMa_003051500 [Elysia marginata]|uniref:Uncharacterized protein n=1 Tax=Elysia marginata TaxID=1093978 RepID=A0AAV4IJX7_9GAST|nr:hypothetical protein ElyMa_003051500 [Elysia marginata]
MFGIYFGRNFQFRSITLLEPSTLTMYWLNCLTSTAMPVLSHVLYPDTVTDDKWCRTLKYFTASLYHTCESFEVLPPRSSTLPAMSAGIRVGYEFSPRGHTLPQCQRGPLEVVPEGRKTWTPTFSDRLDLDILDRLDPNHT